MYLDPKSVDELDDLKFTLQNPKFAYEGQLVARSEHLDELQSFFEQGVRFVTSALLVEVLFSQVRKRPLEWPLGFLSVSGSDLAIGLEFCT